MWEMETGGKKIEKRLDSFWGPKEWMSEITNVITLQRKWIPSNHNLHIIDWET